jgi:hypothetical protein
VSEQFQSTASKSASQLQSLNESANPLGEEANEAGTITPGMASIEHMAAFETDRRAFMTLIFLLDKRLGVICPWFTVCRGTQ